MEYRVRNLDKLESSQDRNYLEKHLEKFIKKMSFIPKKYRRSNEIEVILSFDENKKTKISISANLNTGIISIEREGDNIEEIVPRIFYNFTEKVAEEIKNIRIKYAIDKKNEFFEKLALDKENLKNLSEKEKTELFKTIIPVFLHGLKGYINRRIISAKLADLKSLSNVDPKDVVNEVVLRVHSIFNKEIENIRDINIWLIKEADNILNDILDKNKTENVSYEELVNNELGQLEEKFTVDGGFDLVMTDELDEYDTDFGIEEIIIASKGENEFIDKLEKDKTALKNKVYDELIKLPLRYQSIYDLYYFEYMEIEEIAKVKKLKPIEVEAIIISIKDLLTEKLFN
jgi:DNA-directed RNA polymerase specialized sigma24 family protein